MSEFNEFLAASKIRQKPVSIERRLKSWNIEYDFKWNQPYLRRGSNSLNSASDLMFFYCLVNYRVVAAGNGTFRIITHLLRQISWILEISRTSLRRAPDPLNPWSSWWAFSLLHQGISSFFLAIWVKFCIWASFVFILRKI